MKDQLLPPPTLALVFVFVCGHTRDSGSIDAPAIVQARTRTQHAARMQSVQQQFESNLFTAARHGRADFCREILRRGSASVNARDSCGRTPAHEAARNGHVNVLNVLCECGADLYARSTHGVTIAHQAAFGNHTSFLQELHALLTASGLSEGAQLHQKDDAGRTPLDVARESGCHSAAAFLVALLPPGHPKLQELQPNGAALAQHSISRSTPSMQSPATLAQVHTQARATAHTATQLQLRAHAQMQAQGHEDSDDGVLRRSLF